MKNTIADLNNHLFEQLERLNDEELTPEELEKEIARAEAIEGIADKIIKNATLSLDAAKFQSNYQLESGERAKMPEMLGYEKNK